MYIGVFRWRHKTWKEKAGCYFDLDYENETKRTRNTMVETTIKSQCKHPLYEVGSTPHLEVQQDSRWGNQMVKKSKNFLSGTSSYPHYNLTHLAKLKPPVLIQDEPQNLRWVSDCSLTFFTANHIKRWQIRIEVNFSHPFFAHFFTDLLKFLLKTFQLWRLNQHGSSKPYV